MSNDILIQALDIIQGYLVLNYSNSEIQLINSEINKISNITLDNIKIKKHAYSYEEIQVILSNLNEKEKIRKDKGVYYTPSDVVKFILINSAKMVSNILKPNNLHVLDLNGIPYKSFCLEKTIYDPTCGSGAFLLPALEMKLDLMELHKIQISKSNIFKIIRTIKGNDLNYDSITITKLRLFLCVLHRYGVTKIKNVATVLNQCYKCYDYVENNSDSNDKYDIIVGNPPYVEDSKSESIPTNKYGNIYANVLENASKQLKDKGVMSFVIPLSYVSTPRMKKIRLNLIKQISEQYILSFSDRPDCLFTSVHQKLCVLFGKKSCNTNATIITSNYRYWYKEEREDLFTNLEVIQNNYVTEEFIPKLGTPIDTCIYGKISRYDNSLIQLMNSDSESVSKIFLNMRAAFWIKAFLNEHTGSEYKTFKCHDQNYASLCMCLLNSSLFWWYWICISDCWHITNKELKGFKVPLIDNFEICNNLAKSLEKQLETTKLYVGTKQTEYEYKHKECIELIHQIDDFVNEIYGLTEEESLYIKNFAYRYRMSGGTKNECN